MNPIHSIASSWFLLLSIFIVKQLIFIISFLFLRRYLLEAQDVITGGFSKWPGSSPDPFHTYFSLCGLSFINEEGLEAVMPSLNISQRAYERLCDIQRTWKQQRTNDVTDTTVDIEWITT